MVHSVFCEPEIGNPVRIQGDQPSCFKKESRGDWLHYKTISELLDYKMGMNARHVLIIADRCYAGAAYRGVKLAVERKKKENRFIWRHI